jgi:hypothetical protein
VSALIENSAINRDCILEVKDAIDRLESLHDGARGVLDIVGIGRTAIPALSEVLFRRDPSGLHQARCRAVDALAMLKAYSVLEEFLTFERDISDPVEQLGEDTVVSCAARAIARRHDNRTFSLLVKLARRKPLSGVIAGPGSFKRSEAISLLVDALSEDHVRMTAEASLRSFGARAKAALIQACCPPADGAAPEDDYESLRRKYRSALGLISAMRVSEDDWTRLRPLVRHPDHQIAILACGLCARIGDMKERAAAIQRMTNLRSRCNWLERLQVDQTLQRLARKRKSRNKRKPQTG